MAPVKKLVIFCLLIFTSVSCSERRKVYSCEGSSLSLSCEEGKVIKIIRANFGRLANSVCPSFNNDNTWSTRCINPTSFKVVNSVCGGKSSCSIPVSSSQFADPCPMTPKYLELVYQCKIKIKSSRKLSDMPSWPMRLESMTEVIMKKHIPRKQPIIEKKIRITTPKPAKLYSDYIRRPSAEFLLYIKQVEERKMKEKIQWILNEQRPTDEATLQQSEQSDEENVVLIAIISATISFIFIVTLSIAIIICKNRTKSKSDLESTSSSYSQYSFHDSRHGTEYSFIMAGDGKMYQMLKPSPSIRQPTLNQTVLVGNEQLPHYTSNYQTKQGYENYYDVIDSNFI